MLGLSRLRATLDRVQRRNRVAAFAVGVMMRYRDDRGGRWAALVGYYGFFSTFPLLLSLVTILGIVLKDRPALREDILDSALGRFPVIGGDVQVNGLSGGPVIVALGLATALWAGTAAAQVLQDALNRMWSVPRDQQSSYVMRRVRSLGALLFLGVCLVGSAAITSVATSGIRLDRTVFVLTLIASLLVNVLLVGGTYRLLLRGLVATRSLVPGTLFAGSVLFGLQAVGVLYVTRVVVNAKDTYGAFATVIGLLTWLTLQGHVVLLGNAINVTKAKRLWPRGLVDTNPTEADLRAARDLALRDIHRGLQVNIDVDVAASPADRQDKREITAS